MKMVVEGFVEGILRVFFPLSPSSCLIHPNLYLFNLAPNSSACQCCCQLMGNALSRGNFVRKKKKFHTSLELILPNPQPPFQVFDDSIINILHFASSYYYTGFTFIFSGLLILLLLL